MEDRIYRDNPTIGLTFKEETGCGSSFFSIKFNWKKKIQLVEVFCGSSSKGGCSSNTKMVGRLVSIALQHGVPIEAILDQLDSEVCPTARYRAGRDEDFRKTGNASCSKALASAIRKTLQAQMFFESHKEELCTIFSLGEALKERSQEIARERIKKIEEEAGVYNESEHISHTPCANPEQFWGEGCSTCLKKEGCLIEKIDVEKPKEVDKVDFSDRKEKEEVPPVSNMISNMSVPSMVTISAGVTNNSNATESEYHSPGKRSDGILAQPGKTSQMTIERGQEIDYLISQGICPDCTAKLTHDSGCVTCKSCGFSKC